MWQATWQPFGAPQAITGTLTLDARFPGQWFQLESGLHQNWWRHYDPTTGRYTQPDPLGFVDGPSIYDYARSNTLAKIDPTGRCIEDGCIGEGLAACLASPACRNALYAAAAATAAMCYNLAFKRTQSGGGGPPPDCDQEWRDAREMCRQELSKPNPNGGITGGYSDIENCARGLVSERCGGNPVKRR